MSTLLTRLFTKDEGIDIVQDLIKEKRDNFLQYLINKSSSSRQIEELESRIEKHRYPEIEFLANVNLVYYYLELEQYLVFKDPRYINTQKKLREECRYEFPELFQTDPFLPLLEIDKKHDTLFSYLFLKYMFYSLISRPETASIGREYLSRPSLAEAPPSTLNIVERVNKLQEFKEISRSLKKSLIPGIGVEEAENFYQNSYIEFKNLYPRFKTIRAIEDLIPSEENTLKPDPPVRKLVAINGNGAATQSHTSELEQNKNIFENILDGYIMIDSAGKVLFSNYNAQKILNVLPRKLEGTSIMNLLPREFSLQLSEDLLNSQSGKPNRVIGKRSEIVLKDSSMEDIDYEISISNNYSKSVPTYSIFLKDISDKKHMLEAIRESKIQAERTAKVKSTFLSNMSHEIRTPLNVILGLTEILKKGDITEVAGLRKNLDGIDFSAKNLLSIVNDILDFSKIEAGKLTLQSIDFNLRKVVETLTDGFEIKAREKGLELITEFDNDVPHIVIGDQYRLNQILNNLIGNAIKFTKRGSIKVSVRLLSSDDEHNELQFSVQDTGIGISPDNLEKIFESFYQIQNRENADGTGLGLAITKELVYLQDGTFDAESTPGEGSTFSCNIPYKKSSLVSMANSVKTYVTHDKELEGLKVLVAEDNQMNQFYIKQLLKRLKVEVDIAENGKEAIDMLSNQKGGYDLILMDMHMPVMSGFEAIQHIKEMNEFSLNKIPIVACSADVFPEARKNAIKAGIDFYLTKPLSEDAIKEVLFWLISDENLEPHSQDFQDGMQETGPEKNKNVELNVLMETFDNDQDFVISLLEIFIKTTPEDYQSLQKCIQREYYTRASSLAHKLKSSFMNLGMTVHGHHLQQIESNVATREGLADAKKHLNAFNSLYHKALLEVNLLLIELRNG